MSAVPASRTEAAMNVLIAAQSAHFAAVDTQLPPFTGLPPGELIKASLPDGRQVHGSVYRSVHGPDDVQSLWEPRTLWECTPLLGDTGRDGMRTVLAALGSWLRGEVPEAELNDPDTAVRVMWPSRDVDRAPALLAAGFVPLTVLAMRPASADDLHAREDLVVRRATTADLEELVTLGVHELRYSTSVNGSTLRDDAERLLEGPLRRALLFGGRVLLAEAGGVALGAASCGWASPSPGSSIERLLPDGRWGYVGTLSVAPTARGSGVGRALMSAAHRELCVSEVRGTYLYYDIGNPLSSVFWPRRGYRPLWTKWTARPAGAVR